MSDIPNFSVSLPNTVTFNFVNPGDDNGSTGGNGSAGGATTVGGGKLSYFDLQITGTNALVGNYDGYCIDTDRGIAYSGTLDAKVFSSYETLPTWLTGTGNIELPQNLDLINWIINQNFVGRTSANGAGIFTFGDVQRAIWTLIDDANSTGALGSWTQAKADQIVALAQNNGEGFIPSYNYINYFGEAVTGKLGVILAPDSNPNDSNPVDKQIIIAEVKLSKLGDFVFEDLNKDGIQDVGETGIAGVTVNLLADVNGDGVIGSNEIIATATTNTNGQYHFDVIAGNYKVQFVQPQGFESSPANVGGNDSVDSDGLMSDLITLTPGQSNPTIDTGFYQLASLGDYVFADNNNNGIQDAGDTALGGVTVELIKNGVTVATTLTNTSGGYLFDNLIPGDYQVKFIAPLGYIFSNANVGDDSLDSDANTTTGLTQTVTLTSGEFNGTLDGGLVKLASLGDTVFHDLDADGIQEAEEAGIADATVNLLKDGVVIATATTDADGKYSFSNLTPGIGYQVQFITPGGYTQSSPVDVGSNDGIDSDGTLTGVVTLAPGENNPTLDSGFYNLASLGDYVFADNNNNGIQDAGDTALGGVTVELIKNGVTVATTLTNTSGGYLFDNLIPGDYQVKFIAPLGYIFSNANVGDDSLDSDANTTTGLTQTVTLTSGEFNGTLDGGLVKLASLGDTVFHDLDADGIQEAEEAGIADATVNLLKDGVVIATATTDADGKYSFSNLTPGIGYQVQFITPGGYTQSSPVDVGSNDGIDSDGTLTGVVTLAPGENNPTLDSGFYNLASLGDYVFADNNNNGIQDAGDTALGGVTVELIKNGVTVATTLTNTSGGYLFDNLIPGDYQVKFIAPLGYIFSNANVGDDSLDSDANTTTGLTQTVTLTSGEFNGTLDGGLVKLASLGDTVFHDLDADGIQEAEEAGIADATVNLLKDGVVIATATTDADGKYSFNNLTPGIGYQVQFITPGGYTQSSPVDVGSNDGIDSDGTLTGVVTLAPGENNPTLDSGFYNLASLGDYVFADNNNNGIQDAGDTALGGVTVELIKNGVTVATTLTNTSGGYLFDNLIPGDYQVKFIAPLGYIFSNANVGDDSLDSDANTTTGLTQTVTLTSGEFNGTLDGGLVKLASLGDTVFHDLDADGIQEAEEAGIADATVNLLKDGVVIATATTDADGKYSFNNLTPGIGYQVQFITPGGYTQSSPVDVGSNDGIDSDGTLTGVVTLAPGENNPTLDSGFYNLASLGDYVFADNNNNGIQDAGDTALGGVTVELIKNGVTVATTLTNTSGGYLFDNLIPGDYQVKFIAPLGYIFSNANVGDDSLDSDANTTTGLTQTVTLTSGEFNGTLDGGLVKLASLGDFVFEDSNANGIQDTGEVGVNGVTVTLTGGGADGIINGVGDTTVTTTTNASGIYGFSGLTPGQQYQVGFSNLPTGYQFTQSDIGSDASDSDANTSTGKTQIVTLSSGENNLTLDAGIYKNASLGDRVWEDSNANGIQDTGEVGVNGVTVTLTGGGADGIINGVGDTTVTTTTNASGIYGFSGLTPGQQYQVGFSNLPTGYQFTQSDIGSDASDSDANTSTGKTQIVTLSSGENNLTLDAGIYKNASLGDRVWEDSNANGIQDTGEVGVNGVTVTLTGGGADGIINGVGDTTVTTTTNASGIYGFSGLTPGQQYQVGFSNLPTGYQFTQSDIGSDASDSDANTSTGKTQIVTLSSGENNLTLDAGIYKNASLGDRVWEDSNANGIQDTGEVGVNGVTVTLTGGGADGIINGVGDTTVTTTTNASGIYGFSGLTPGQQYQVGFSNLPTGYQFTQSDIGSDASDSDANTSTGKTQIVTLSSGENNLTLDAGIYKNASLGDRVWEDSNANGIQDTGEVGVNGVTVTLTGGGADGIINGVGDTTVTTTTNASGIYGFSGLTPGQQYQVGFSNLPTGYQFTQSDIGSDTSDSDANTTTGKTQIVTLSSGENNLTLDAGIYKNASLGDRVWEDSNANGIQDTGEVGVNGVTVTLTGGGADGIINGVGDTTVTTTTNASGIYGFSGLTPGQQYQVGFSNLPTGYQFTQSDIGSDASDSDANTSTGKTQIVTLSSGENNLTLDAGIYKNASLGDRVWEDSNANGIQDTGEVGVNGVTVTLTGGGADGIINGVGDTTVTTTTNASGIYGFSGLTPGQQYQVGFSNLPTGYQFTQSDIGSDASDSDANTSTGKTQIVTLSSGENNLTLDAGIYKNASLGDRVWEDSNANGIQDTGEVGVNGVTVTLTGGGADGIINGVGDTTVTTTTNASGIYGFSGLTPGQQYQVGFSNLPTGYQFTQSDIGSDASDSDANTSTGKTQIVTLSSGENNLTLDAGIYKNAGDLSITKTDGLSTVSAEQQITYTIVAQNNGLITATNALVSDIMPTNLTNVSWTSVATGGATGNDLTGTGNINDYVTLVGGSTITYTVLGTVAASTTTLGSAGTFSLSGNSALDGTDGNIRTFTATNGVQVQASAFSQINGTTWSNAYLGSYGGGLGVTNSNEGDGSNNMHVVDNSGSNDYILFEFSESVVVDKASLGYVVGDSDMSIWIGSANNPFTNHINLNSSVLTTLGFTEVNNGSSSTRTADINNGNVVGNVLVIAAKIGEADDNFKVNTLDVNKVVQSTSSLTNTATITAPTGFTDTNSNNNSATDIDTIGVPTVKIGDRVWYDTNGNGIQDTGESGVAGVTVKLLNQAGSQIGTTTTDANGLYQFTANSNSTYSVQFLQPTTGFNGFTTADIGNDAADSDVVDAATGKTATFTVGTTDNLTIDAGLIKNNVDLSITKTDGLTTVTPGQQITYTIVVGNNGPMTATNALVSDVMPTNLTGVTWTSLATTGATGNDLTGTGNINDTVTLATGSSITYTVKGTVAPSTTTLGSAATFDLSGNNNTVTYGNSRTFTNNGITLTAKAFSRVDGTNGAWETASLNSYSGGLGVIDRGEGTGANNTHTVDNTGGRDNYVVFQFSEGVVLNRANLGYVVGDSDISLWIGNFGSPVSTLSDSVLNSFGFTEVNDTTLTTARWADVNAGNYAGNTIVIAASTADTTPDDYFKIQNLDVNKVVQGTSSLTNTATITAPTGFTDTNPNNNSATDTDIIGGSMVTGTSSHDKLTGTIGDDLITGGLGCDTLSGGSGGDRFIYNASNEGTDIITDFNSSQDLIQITASGSGFSGKGLVAGNALLASQFVLGSSATNASQRFIYNSSTGGLFFDGDGNGAGAAVQLATLTGNPTLTNQNFWVA